MNNKHYHLDHGHWITDWGPIAIVVLALIVPTVIVAVQVLL